jgi:hypothetical protein
MVFIGLISYSLYLWHWPVFTVMRLHSGSIHLTPAQGAAGVVLSVALAALSWRFVEQPFRRGMPFRRAAAILLAGGTVTLGAAAVLIAAAGLPGRLNDDGRRLLSAAADIDPYRDICAEAGVRNACVFGPEGAPLRYAIVGDSHAPALRPAIASAAAGLEGRGTMWWSGACPLLDGAWMEPAADGPGCLAFKTQVLAALAAAPEIDTVFLVGRWEYQLTGRRAEVGGSQTDYLVDGQSDGRSPAETERAFARAVTRSLDALGAMGKRVVIIGAVPQPGFDVPRSLALAALNGRDGHPEFDARAVRGVSARIDDVFRRAVEGRPYASYVPIDDIFCDEDCALMMEGIPLYYDHGHLTGRAAAEFLGPKLGERIRAALAT